MLMGEVSKKSLPGTHAYQKVPMVVVPVFLRVALY